MRRGLKFGFTGVMAVLGLGVLVSCADANNDVDVYAKENAKNIAVLKLGTHTSLNEIEDNIVKTLKTELDETYKVSLYDCNFQTDLITQTLNSLDKNDLACVVSIATPVAVAASNMLSDIPVVFSAVSDPVAAGVVGNNVTGTSDKMQLDKLVNLALEVNSNVKKIGYIYTATEANSIQNKETLEKLCKDKNIELVSRSINNAGEITESFNAINDMVDCFIVSDDNNVASAMDTFSSLCANKNIPLYCAADSEIKDGGMMGYSINYSNLGKFTALQVVDIVKNRKKVSDVAVKYFDKEEDLNLYYNSGFLAKATGITIPESLLNKATDLFEE